MATDTVNTIKKLFDITGRDIDGAVSFYTDDCIYEDVALGKVTRGKRELKAFMKESFDLTPDVRLEATSIFSAGDWAAAEWVMTGTHTGGTPQMPATGKKFSVRGASIIQTRGGKITRQSDYWNLATFLQQVGLMPGGTG